MSTSNLSYEQEIIGFLIKDSNNQKAREILDTLSNEDFTSVQLSFIYKNIKEMSETKEEFINLETLDNRLSTTGGEYGGWSYLAQMSREYISVGSIPSYIRGIKKAKSYRDIQKIMHSVNDAISKNIEIDEITNMIDQSIKEITINSNGKELNHIKHTIGGFVDDLEERFKAGGVPMGLSTGFENLDRALGGVDKESLVVIAGRPSMGKTLICQTIAQHIGIDLGKNLMFFSLEMSERQLSERFISGLANVSAKSLRIPDLASDEFMGKIDSAINKLTNSGIYYTEEPNQSLGQIRAKVRRHKIKFPDLSCVFIDYLGLMKMGKAQSLSIAIGDVTRGLKELAKEMQVPIFLIAQANRGADEKKRPNMSNLKDSSSIEADADVVIFIHRDEVMNPETQLKGVTELIVAKDRHNDGAGIYYAEKINGRFVDMDATRAGQIENSNQNPVRVESGMAPVNYSS